MYCSKLFFHKYGLSPSHFLSAQSCFPREFSSSKTVQSEKKKDYKYFDPKTVKTEEDFDLPLKFSSTGAHKIEPILYHGGKKEDDSPPYQAKVVVASLTIFMLYFFALREENDIDLAMRGEGSNAAEVDDIFRRHLVESKRLMTAKGLDTFDVDLKLRELDAKAKERNEKLSRSS